MDLYTEDHAKPYNQTQHTDIAKVDCVTCRKTIPMDGNLYQSNQLSEVNSFYYRDYVLLA